MEIEASARKHGVHDDDMLDALRHHFRAFETDDVTVTMYIGPSRTGAPLEIGVAIDDDGEAIIHATATRPKFLKGRWDDDDASRKSRGPRAMGRRRGR